MRLHGMAPLQFLALASARQKIWWKPVEEEAIEYFRAVDAEVFA